MIKILIIIVVVLVIAFKIKFEIGYRKEQKEEEEERQRRYQERKQNGEPSVCTALPAGSDDPGKEWGIGPDGKRYPLADGDAGILVADNFSSGDYQHKRYEYSPVYCMMVYEQYIPEFIERLKKEQMHPLDIEYGLGSIFELAEGYAYPVPAKDDLTQGDYFTIRRLKDRKRAMEGNGYYKNAYDFPINRGKALTYFEVPELIRARFGGAISEAGDSAAFLVSRSWLQTAHLYSAGLGGIKRDVKRAIKLYSQAFQMAMSYSHEDEAYQIVHALTDGYPRNPEDYHVQAHNMLGDWACRSDFGFALYIEYMLHAQDLDSKRMAESPEAAVQYFRELADENYYAAYLLGKAMLYGYGIAKDSEKGFAILEIAAESGCISAMYLLQMFSIGVEEEERKWKEILEQSVAQVKETFGSVRGELEKAGMDRTAQRMETYRREQEEEQRRAQQAAMMREFERPSDSYVTEEAGNDWEPFDDTPAGFQFPQYIFDNDDNRWELLNSGGDNANYYCRKTGGTIMFYDSDFEYGAPSGFYRR